MENKQLEKSHAKLFQYTSTVVRLQYAQRWKNSAIPTMLGETDRPSLARETWLLLLEKYHYWQYHVFDD